MSDKVLVSREYTETAQILERAAHCGNVILRTLWVEHLKTEVILTSDLLAGLTQYKADYGVDWPETQDDLTEEEWNSE